MACSNSYSAAVLLDNERGPSGGMSYLSRFLLRLVCPLSSVILLLLAIHQETGLLLRQHNPENMLRLLRGRKGP
jgi:hypothetical protein